MKRVILGFINGFCVSIAITIMIQVLIMGVVGQEPLLPEFEARFDSAVMAFAVQLVLIGLMSGITSAGTAIFELRKVGLITQSLLFLLIMLSAWIPISCIVWGFHKHVVSMLSTICSIVVTYGICWGIQYKLCRKNIEDINNLLSHERESL